MKRLKKFFKRLGPGFVTGAADDDPSGIATYAQTGVIFGYHQLWTALFSTPFMVSIQEMASRIAMVTGRGLAAIIRENYSPKILYVIALLLFIVNTINIGADLGAMAQSAQLIFGLPFIFWLIAAAAISLILEIFLSYKTYAKFLKYLALSLFAYVLTAFVVRENWGEILYRTFVPLVSFKRAYLLNIVAILGTTISPYLFFWQAESEIEEERARHRPLSILKLSPERARADLKNMRGDTIWGMIFSNLIMFFIMVTMASTLGVHKPGFINTASEAAEALRPLAGDFAFILFALGIISTGLLAVPILAGSASYALIESLGWKEGLSQRLKQALGFYGIIIVATVLGIIVNFAPLKPFQLLYYTAVLNGIISPLILMILLKTASSKKIMGEYTNSFLSNIMGWILFGVMTLAVLALFANIIF